MFVISLGRVCWRYLPTNLVLKVSQVLADREKQATWVQLKAQGPAPRFYHAAVVISTNPVIQMLVFGGKTNAGDANDMWILKIGPSMGDVAWESVKQNKKSAPAPRHGHTIIYASTMNAIVLQGANTMFYRKFQTFECYPRVSPHAFLNCVFFRWIE
jgi:hypothetical protein